MNFEYVCFKSLTLNCLLNSRVFYTLNFVIYTAFYTSDTCSLILGYEKLFVKLYIPSRAVLCIYLKIKRIVNKRLLPNIFIFVLCW